MLVIGNKKYRNLQEQVGWNTEQIDKIFEFLDGINVSDNVVVVTDISTPLTSEELAIVDREVSFIVYNGELYFKRNQDASNIYFDVIFAVSGSTVITFASSEITVTKSNGALGIANSSVQVYSKAQTDTLVGAKADSSYVSTQLALKANLAGASFTGAISAPTMEQANANYDSGVLSLSNADPNTLTYNLIFAKFQVVNQTLKAVMVLSVENPTASPINFKESVTGILDLPSKYYDKIYDILGNNLTVVDNQSHMIRGSNAGVFDFASMRPIQIATPLGFVLSHYNYQLQIRFKTVYSGLEIPANSKYVFFGEMNLTLV